MASEIERFYLVRCGECGFLSDASLGHCAKCGYDGFDPSSEGIEQVRYSDYEQALAEKDREIETLKVAWLDADEERIAESTEVLAAATAKRQELEEALQRAHDNEGDLASRLSLAEERAEKAEARIAAFLDAAERPSQFDSDSNEYVPVQALVKAKAEVERVRRHEQETAEAAMRRVEEAEDRFESCDQCERPTLEADLKVIWAREPESGELVGARICAVCRAEQAQAALLERVRGTRAQIKALRVYNDEEIAARRCAMEGWVRIDDVDDALASLEALV